MVNFSPKRIIRSHYKEEHRVYEITEFELEKLENSGKSNTYVTLFFSSLSIFFSAVFALIFYDFSSLNDLRLVVTCSIAGLFLGCSIISLFGYFHSRKKFNAKNLVKKIKSRPHYTTPLHNNFDIEEKQPETFDSFIE